VGIDSALEHRGLAERAVVVLTHAEVDPADPAFAAPTKPIGGTMTPEVARRRVSEEGWTVTETGKDSFRRVVPSPKPRVIIESSQIRSLMDTGAVVVAAGGGGIPVVRENGAWRSIDAVIDKDRASALLAATSGVDTLVLVTGVDEVYVGYGTERQRALRDVEADEMRDHVAAGEFPAGSMGPKVESALAFVDAGGGHAVITSLPRLREALAGATGTHLYARDHSGPDRPDTQNPPQQQEKRS